MVDHSGNLLSSGFRAAPQELGVKGVGEIREAPALSSAGASCPWSKGGETKVPASLAFSVPPAIGHVSAKGYRAPGPGVEQELTAF